MRRLDPDRYVMCTGTDGDPQLVARDVDTSWIVVELGGRHPRLVDRTSAEGEIAYYQQVLGHPAWLLERGPTTVWVFEDGASTPAVLRSRGYGASSASGELHRSVLEAASWRLASELARRHPDRLRVYETHPGGGQYDCLTLASAGSSPTPLVYLNRVGTIQVHTTLDGQQPEEIQEIDWATYLAAAPSEFLRGIERDTGLAAPDAVPPTQPHTLVYRCLALAASVEVLGVRTRAIVSGFVDSSTYPGVRDELFAAMPAADRRRETVEADDPFGYAEYRFWFVTEHEEPVAWFETTGWAGDTSGREVDLMEAYKRRGRRVGATLTSVLPELLP
jgi:hypothetical protein